MEGNSAFVVLNHTSYRKVEIVKITLMEEQPKVRAA
jgi:hypothetical protein